MAMTERIFEDYGVVLLKRDDKFFVQYDAGHIAMQMRKNEVSEQQAFRLQQGEQFAHQVLLEVERAQRGVAT
jgi:hypothetical protein